MTVSGFSISHITGSAASVWPTVRIVGSLSCGRNCTASYPFLPRLYGSPCQVRNAALIGSNAGKPFKNGAAPRTDVGTLPQCQAFSAMEMNRPASDSNSSRYAWPKRLGLGFETASSAETLRKEGASVRTPGRASATRVSHVGWNRSSVERPPMKLEDGSNPSGGALKVLCSFWNTPLKFNHPVVPRSSRPD